MGAAYERARILFEHRRYDLAEQELHRELAAEPQNGLAHAFLGHCLGRRGKLEEGRQAVEEGIRLAPDLGYAHRVRGWILRQQGHWPEAEAALQEALRLEPQDIHHLDELAFIQYKR